MGFFNQFQENQHRLNDQELEILKYLMDHTDELKNETLKTVAGTLFVSPNTIVRMAKKLDYQGYLEMKLAIAMEQKSKPTKPKTHAVSLLDQLTQTQSLINDQVIEGILQDMKEAGHVYFFACGPSKYPCEEMKEKLKILGINASLYFEPHVMKQRATKLVAGDVVFVVSLSGETATPLAGMKLARLTEAKMISITGFSQNTVSQLADIALYTFYDDLSVSDMDVSSRLGIHYILNYIFEKLAAMCS